MVSSTLSSGAAVMKFVETWREENNYAYQSHLPHGVVPRAEQGPSPTSEGAKPFWLPAQPPAWTT